MLKNKTIIIPFTIPFDWSADYQKQTCLQLAKKHKVICYMNDDAYFFLKKEKKYPKIRNLTFYCPKYIIPFRRFLLIEKINRKLSYIIFSLRYMLMNPIIWIFDPQFFYFPDFFIKNISLYDCVDYHSSIDNKTDEIIRLKEHKLINKVDLFFVNSETLKSIHKHKKQNIHLVPQGFRTDDYKNYSIKKRTGIKNKKITIGYIGGINYRFDYHLLTKLIINNPQWQFEFWGPIQDDDQDKKIKTDFKISLLKRMKNTTWNNTYDKKILARAINNFDICIIPYDVRQKINLYSYPMKVFEYFYFNKPVISTQILEFKTKKFNNLIKLSNNYLEWETHIKNIIGKSKKTTLANNRKKTFALKNSWEEKINKIINTISRL